MYRLINSVRDRFSAPQVSLNGETLNAKRMQTMSTFVEQEDALLGVLTVRESVSYALRLQCVYFYLRLPH